MKKNIFALLLMSLGFILNCQAQKLPPPAGTGPHSAYERFKSTSFKYKNDAEYAAGADNAYYQAYNLYSSSKIIGSMSDGGGPGKNGPEHNSTINENKFCFNCESLRELWLQTIISFESYPKTSYYEGYKEGYNIGYSAAMNMDGAL